MIELFWMLNLWYQTAQEEYIGIKLTDGLYDENNKEYYITYNKDNVIFHYFFQAPS